MAKRGRPPKNGGADALPGAGDNSKAKPVPSANIIAAAMTEILEIETEMASLSGKKGGVFNRYEAQGVDREVLRGLVKLAGKKTADEARAYITDLTKYSVAAGVIVVADAAWSEAVKQGEIFAAADGDEADRLRRVQARKAGFAAGKKGHNESSCPHLAGSAGFVGWREGLREGLAVREMLRPGSANVTQASVSRARRQPGAGGDAEAAALGRAVAVELAEADGGIAREARLRHDIH